MAVHTEEPPRKPKAYRPVSETRKVRKPLMERKRRERINSSLEQLALLLKEAKLVAADKPVAKLEKADILELTVRHLKSVRRANFISEGAVETQVKKEVENSQSDTKPSDRDNTKHVCGENSANQNEIYDHEKVSADEIRNDKEPHKVLGERISDSNYLEGFHKCLSEVRQATESAQEFCALKERLFDHLDSCLHNLTLETTPKEKIGSGKRTLSQRNDCEIKGSKKRKRCDKDGHQSPIATAAEIPPELTLVPMQLTDGRVAFLVHGDAKILISNKSTDAGKPMLPSRETFKQSSNDLNGLTKKFPKLLPASELHKIPNGGKLNSSLDCKPYGATPSPIAERVSKISTEKMPLSTSEEAALRAPASTKVTNLLKLYPNIKTVNLPVGNCVTNVQSNNLITVPQSSVTSSVGSTQLQEMKSDQSLRVEANGENSSTLEATFQKPFRIPNVVFSEGHNLQTPFLLPNNTGHASCATSQASVRKCVVYSGPHLVSNGASFPVTVTHQAMPTTVATGSVSTGPHVLHVAVPNSQSANRTVQANNAILLSDSRVPLDPSRSLVNIDQIAGPSVVSFPPTPPPSADQYVSELPVDGNQYHNIPSSFGSVRPNSSLKTTAQSCNLPSHPTIVSGMYSYLQYCPPTSQEFLRPTCAMKSVRDDEEFIDVENISKEDHSLSYGSSVNNENLNYNDEDKGDMWRPW